MKKNEIRNTILEVTAESLKAQLRAVNRLRGRPDAEKPQERGMSQTDMVYDILRTARQPMHITQIIEQVQRRHGRRLERESIVSALSKKVARQERFLRTGKNTFALKEDG